MGAAEVGKVLVTAKIQNLEDLFSVQQGRLLPEEVRSVSVPDALVDTRATGLMVPKRLIAQLGLREFRRREAKTVGGTITMGVHQAAQLTIQGRDCTVDVNEVADDLPVLTGQIPLEALDWVVDTVGQTHWQPRSWRRAHARRFACAPYGFIVRRMKSICSFM
jgi:predicted aspartyl protease